MSVPSGTRLGPYEILELLGRGGMGEVYRARDVRLGRLVAIKVLPETLSPDPHRRQQLHREARTISQLNHPNVCVLFDVGSEAGLDYLVMEYLEGETLADRLRRGPLPVAEILRIGAEIASAVEAAHERGVIHRDLKPGNVILTKSGAKVLDFGLAKGLAPAPPTDATFTETLVEPLTREGTVAGTLHYMAPEQLEAKLADRRTDIWGLGCMLYEMAVGTTPFENQSPSLLIAAILRDSPALVHRQRPELPPQLGRVVRRCLEKKAEARYQSAMDVRSELEFLREERERVSTPSVPSQTASSPPVGEAKPPEKDEAVPPPEIRYCRTADGVNLAWATVGEGTPLVRALGWFTHLDIEWQWPIGREFWEVLARRHRLVRYDGRGIGLSEREATEFTLETRLLDLEAVVDAARLERFALMGMSEGGATAIAYAARHPERVSHLILYGTFAGGVSASEKERWGGLVGVIRSGWGESTGIYRRLFTHMFLGPNANPEQMYYFDELLKASATPETAATYQQSCLELDVRDLHANVETPTLVIHRRGDLVVPFASGQHLASRIPGARFLPMEGSNHGLLFKDEGLTTFVDAIEAFVGTARG